MNTVTTIKIDRPPEIAEDAPVPFAINNTFKLTLKAEWENGSPVNLTGAKIYLTIKAALTALDAAATYQKNSTDNGTIVDIDDTPTTGRYNVIVPADALTSLMTVDTVYYIDTEIIVSGGTVFTHLYDTIKPFQQVTKSVS